MIHPAIIDPEIQQEIMSSSAVRVNLNHSQQYGVLLHPELEQTFIFAVDVDQEIEASVLVYWDYEGTYVISKKAVGEEVKIQIYQNSRTLIKELTLYHTSGIQFHARKE